MLTKNTKYNYMVKRAAAAWVKKYRGGQLSPEALQRVAHGTGQIRQLGKQPLGQGAEGVAHTVTHPKSPTGIAVQKAYDPSGPLYSRRFIREKDKIFKALSSSPEMASYYGKHSNLPVTYHEYVPGKTLESELALLPSDTSLKDFRNISNKAKDLQARLQLEANKKNLGILKDIESPGNVVITPEGGLKAIDFLPRYESFSKFKSPSAEYVRMKQEELQRQLKQSNFFERLRSIFLGLPKEEMRHPLISEASLRKYIGYSDPKDVVAARVFRGKGLIKFPFTDLDPRYTSGGVYNRLYEDPFLKKYLASLPFEQRKRFVS